MKKTLLILFIGFATLLKAQIPDISISAFEASTSADTIFATTSIQADSAGLTYTVVHFLSTDAEFSEDDSVLGVYEQVSAVNSTSTVRYKTILPGTISTDPLYIITVVTYDFDANETPLDVATFTTGIGQLAPDSDITNNFSVDFFTFTQEAVDEHNGPAPDTTNNDTTGMTSAEAFELVEVTTFELGALEGSGLVIDRGGSYHVSLVKNFEIKNGLNVNLNDMVVSVYLSADGGFTSTPEEDDLLISKDTITLAPQEDLVINTNASIDIHKYFDYQKTNIEALSTIGYWGNSVTDPEYESEFLSRVLVTLEYRLGDTLNQSKLYNYGEATFTWNAVGIKESLTQEDISVQNLATTTLALKSNYNGKLTLVDLNGIQVLKRDITKGENTLNVGTLNRGIYILNVETLKGIRAERVILK